MIKAAIGALLVASAGATWVIKNDEFATIALSVDFVNDEEGYVPDADNGSGAAVLKTKDAGVSWNPCPGATGLMFLAGAAAGNNAVVGGMFDALYSTNNGEYFNASTFEPEPIAASQSLEGCPKNDKFFGMAGGGLTQGNGVAITTNGGQNYTFYNVSELRTLSRYGSYPSENVWYLSAGQWPAESTGDLHQLSARLHVHPKTGKLTVADIDSSVGDDDGPGTWAAQIVRTLDAGKTWETVFWANSSFYFNQISCASEQHCCAVAEGEAGNYIFCSQDGGKNWKITMHTQGSDESIFSVVALSPQEWWAGGGVLSASNFTGVFYHSLNGGQTWNTTTVPDVYPNDISFPSEQHGFATAFTRDGQSALLEYSP